MMANQPEEVGSVTFLSDLSISTISEAIFKILVPIM